MTLIIILIIYKKCYSTTQTEKKAEYEVMSTYFYKYIIYKNI